MKKTLSILAAIVVISSVVACGPQAPQDDVNYNGEVDNRGEVNDPSVTVPSERAPTEALDKGLFKQSDDDQVCLNDGDTFPSNWAESKDIPREAYEDACQHICNRFNVGRKLRIEHGEQACTYEAACTLSYDPTAAAPYTCTVSLVTGAQ